MLKFPFLHSCFKMSRMEGQKRNSKTRFIFVVYLLPFLPILFQGDGGSHKATTHPSFYPGTVKEK